MVDPEQTYVDVTVQLAPDVTLFPGVVLQGATVVHSGSEIGPGTRLVDCVIGENVRMDSAVGRDADVGNGAVVGPFAVLEPGSRVPSRARTGPFYTATADEPGTTGAAERREWS
jgi:bifunctional UDP-N-acetylglucosamine pyrophosphorylase/glucosamine-1-phosphate N-acetyltransferase